MTQLLVTSVKLIPILAMVVLQLCGPQAIECTRVKLSPPVGNTAKGYDVRAPPEKSPQTATSNPDSLSLWGWLKDFAQRNIWDHFGDSENPEVASGGSNGNSTTTGRDYVRPPEKLNQGLLKDEDDDNGYWVSFKEWCQRNLWDYFGGWGESQSPSSTTANNVETREQRLEWYKRQMERGGAPVQRSQLPPQPLQPAEVHEDPTTGQLMIRVPVPPPPPTPTVPPFQSQPSPLPPAQKGINQVGSSEQLQDMSQLLVRVTRLLDQLQSQVEETQKRARVEATTTRAPPPATTPPPSKYSKSEPSSENSIFIGSNQKAPTATPEDWRDATTATGGSNTERDEPTDVLKIRVAVPAPTPIPPPPPLPMSKYPPQPVGRFSAYTGDTWTENTPADTRAAFIQAVGSGSCQAQVGKSHLIFTLIMMILASI